MKKTRLLAAVVVAVLLAACSSSSKSTSSGSSSSSVALTQGSDIKIEVVTHGQASDPFWSVVKNGVAYSLDQIIAPFKSPVQLAARRKALAAFDKACKEDARNCYVEMTHTSTSAGD